MTVGWAIFIIGMSALLVFSADFRRVVGNMLLWSLSIGLMLLGFYQFWEWADELLPTRLASAIDKSLYENLVPFIGTIAIVVAIRFVWDQAKARGWV